MMREWATWIPRLGQNGPGKQSDPGLPPVYVERATTAGKARYNVYRRLKGYWPIEMTDIRVRVHRPEYLP